MSKTLDELKEGCRRFVDEVFNKRNLDYAERTLTANFVEHLPPAGLPPDKSGAIARLKRFVDASDDLRAETLDVVSDGRHVGVRGVTRAPTREACSPGCRRQDGLLT
jgi:hypothetical protein